MALHRYRWDTGRLDEKRHIGVQLKVSAVRSFSSPKSDSVEKLVSESVLLFMQGLRARGQSADD